MPFGKTLRPGSAHGYTIHLDPVAGFIERETRMCIHCGVHWIYQQGSGRTRGWCMRCNGMTCGSKKCDTCYPLEKQIEDMEKQGKRNSSIFLDTIQEITS